MDGIYRVSVETRIRKREVSFSKSQPEWQIQKFYLNSNELVFFLSSSFNLFFYVPKELILWLRDWSHFTFAYSIMVKTNSGNDAVVTPLLSSPLFVITSTQPIFCCAKQILSFVYLYLHPYSVNYHVPTKNRIQNRKRKNQTRNDDKKWYLILCINRAGIWQIDEEKTHKIDKTRLL